MIKQHNNYAFIDSQNVQKGVRSLGWELDWVRFRIYLQEKYGVDTAYLFVGFVGEYTQRYVELQKAGFILQFKPILVTSSGKVKGNVDADLVLQAAVERDDYEQAVIVTSDGDFYSLVRYLYQHGKLRAVLSPRADTCSVLLKKNAKGKMAFMDRARPRLAGSK
jgi:uncharacterized LabA/DUF88 family protein